MTPLVRSPPAAPSCFEKKQEGRRPEGWSLGVGFGFYLIFPALFLLRDHAALPWVVATLIAGSLAYPFMFLTVEPLTDQWPAYVAMPNHLAFFLGGVVIARIGPRRSMIWFLPLPLGALLVYEVGDQIEIVTGVGRLVAFAASCALVAAVGSIRVAPSAAARPLIWLGDVSFALYLLHPIAYDQMPLSEPAMKAVAAALLAAVAAHISFNAFERPLTRFGRSLEARLAAA